MLVVLKAACLAIYGLALAGLACFLPNKLSHTMQVTASVFLVIHVIELVFAFRKVRLYRGSLAMSALLTILFGLLHWLPLTNAKAFKK